MGSIMLHIIKKTYTFKTDAWVEINKIFECKIVIFFYPSLLICVLGPLRNGSFEYPQHTLWLRNKKINI